MDDAFSSGSQYHTGFQLDAYCITMSEAETIHKEWEIPSSRNLLSLQVCKQTTSNPDANSDLRGWQLLLCILAVVFPSDVLMPFVENHCELVPVGSIPQTYAEYSLSAMRKVRLIWRYVGFSRVRHLDHYDSSITFSL